jgi:DNA modification methylase
LTPAIKPKDLLGIPWRVAFALQADGWYLRSAIVWHKPNPMPESVTDRPTSAYEMVFLLTKAERYFYDAGAIREEGVIPAGTKGAKGSAERFNTPGVNSRPPEYKIYDGFRNARNVWTISPKPFKGSHFATMPPELAERCIKAGSRPGDTVLDPFGGAGTTGLVADRLKRDAVLIELNPTYADLARDRLVADAVMFGDVSNG